MLVIGLQICWPLTTGAGRARLTIVTVILFAATSLMHAWLTRGARWAVRYLLITFSFSLAVEVLGVTTGFPFSSYSYSTELGPRVANVPLIIPLAWVMMAYPALLLARRLGQPRVVAVCALGAVALTGWDLFLDSQMVSQGYWTWSNPTPALVGIPGIPAINFAGWLLASVTLILLLEWLLASQSAPEGVPALLWTWTWIGGVVANVFFFDKPWVALWGGIVMGVVTAPYLIALRADPAPAW